MLVDRLRHRVDIVWQQTLELSCWYDRFEYMKTHIRFSEILLESLNKQNYFVLMRVWLSIWIKIWKWYTKEFLAKSYLIVTSMIWTYNIYLIITKIIWLFPERFMVRYITVVAFYVVLFISYWTTDLLLLTMSKFESR